MLESLNYSFKNPDLLVQALTHRSYHFENKGKTLGHFERLEFLGDAVLDLVISELLMQAYPEADEGTLSKWRASLVNETSLAELAIHLGLRERMLLGRSEDMQRDHLRPRILASTFEALLAAIYLDSDLATVRDLIRQLFAKQMSSLDHQNEFATDFKTRLQEWTQKRFRSTPDYAFIESDGPEHAKRFRYSVTINGELLGQGEGHSRKSAEQDAARQALRKIDEGDSL